MEARPVFKHGWPFCLLRDVNAACQREADVCSRPGGHVVR